MDTSTKRTFFSGHWGSFSFSFGNSVGRLRTHRRRCLVYICGSKEKAAFLFFEYKPYQEAASLILA